ncbi:Lipase, GDSL domain protein [Candidatus Omnitrophus magneticus]|uniref:Lipase, GDSL domain protein n=1 Tax=Candidatus Omnitrophus magneticus TaxID=1609969 RepID=A0A0F0CRY3_9BACT|nr:Lipase, GDSL domain protein [Candidatus Omnitrophus magneticus]
MYKNALEADIKPIAMTIPPTRCLKGLIPRRTKVNKEIIKESKRLKIECVDICTAMIDKDLLLSEKYSNDGVHLTTEGYMLIAELLYKKCFLTMSLVYKD